MSCRLVSLKTLRGPAQRFGCGPNSENSGILRMTNPQDSRWLEIHSQLECTERNKISHRLTAFHLKIMLRYFLENCYNPDRLEPQTIASQGIRQWAKRDPNQ